MEIVVEKRAEVALFKFSRPHRMNALTLDGFTAAAASFDRIAEDVSIRALVITGEGPVFCAGLSLESILREMGTSPEGGIADERMRVVFDTTVNAMMQALSDMPKPIVCAVNGAASGGGVGLALAGDVVLAGESAFFHLPFTPKLAIVPDCGASWYASRLAGRGRALPAMLTGERIGARKALDWGLVWEVIEDDALLETALAMAGRLAKGPIEVVRDLRQTVDAAAGQGLEKQLALEKAVNSRLCGKRHFAEGVNAFLEKRAPDFGSIGGEN